MSFDDSQRRPDAQLDGYLTAAIAAARAGGAVINEGARNRATLQIERKQSNDFVSMVDKGSERAILDLLAAQFPSHAFIAEETGNSGSSDYVWLIDPLDGTTNFLHGFPQYCVSIALRLGDEVMVGVIFDPVSDRLFTATKGGGAWLNGERIQVSARPSLGEAMVGTGIPFTDWSFIDAYMESLRIIMQRCGGIRRAGAAALDLAFVAAGWLDGFWEKNLHPWDVGAGSLLIQEAGGVISDFSGGTDYINSGQTVAGAPGVHRELVEVLGRYPALAAPRYVKPV
ncbi:MAG: inositol monophosphatase family protein [Betaproteobacteria bacterium]